MSDERLRVTLSARQALPPFSGDDPTCPKCGNVGASTAYMEYGTCEHRSEPMVVLGWERNERLHRDCRRCGYAWDEATVPEGSSGVEGR